MRNCFLLLFWMAWCTVSFAQSAPLDSWRLHPSFNRVCAAAQLDGKIYAASANGIFIVQPPGNETEKITIPLLGSTAILTLAADAARTQLLAGYATGQLDILQGKNIFRFNRIRTTPEITGSKAIHHIGIKNNHAYVATDFGVVVFDLAQREIRETWRNLGPAGEQQSVYQIAFKGDSIFLATDNGIQGGNLNDNLSDFSRWRRFDQGGFRTTFTSLVSFNGTLYTAIAYDGVYLYEEGTWTRQSFLIGESAYRLFASGASLYIVAGNRLFRFNTAHEMEEITSELFTNPLCVLESSAGLAVGDAQNGLALGNGTTWQKILPNGPTFDVAFRLYEYRNRLFAVSGGYTDLFTPAGIEQPVNWFQLGGWSTNEGWLSRDVTDVAYAGNKVCVGSFSQGLQVISDTENLIFNSGNSPLTGSRVSALATWGGAVWIANYNSLQPLHKLNPDNTFQSYSFPVMAARYPLDMVIDKLGQIWMRLNPATGGGILVFNENTNNHVYLTEITGSGGLPSRNVFSLAVDRNGFVWAGTDAGVAYFPNPASVFSGNINAVKPVYEGRFLLRDEKITAITIDGGNRKWFGTERGIWLFDATVTEQLRYFNTTSAPLPSDEIQDLLATSFGEVLIATARGLASYQTDATEPEETPTIRIFPNPVPATFTGWVRISGLTAESTVRITDLSGRLIWQGRSNGGLAAWNVRDHGGQRPPTGIYLVFAISADGKETLAGKLALIN
jgi:ligand-binding sensor domain-containing protein